MYAWMVVEPNAPLQRFELPTPQPAGDEVLIEVTHAGVCHSDLHFWKGEYNMGGGKVMRLADRGVQLPRAPGHEIAGRVTAVGPAVRGVKVGALRVVYPWLGCGHCAACQAAEDNMCSTPRAIGVVRNGGYGSHVLVPHERYLFDPGNVDPGLAATYACSGITVYSAARKLLPLPPDTPVLLIGAGGLGLLAIAMLRALGHRRIISADIGEDKLTAARVAGATDVIEGGERLAARVLETAGPVAGVLDFVNNNSTARAGLEVLAKGGKLVLVGVAGGELTLSLATMIFKAQTVFGSLTGSPADLRAVLELANSGTLAPTPVQSCAHDAVNEALLDLKAGRVTGRMVLVR